MASDWPSSPRKDGWNYCIAAWPIRGLVVPHENWREMLYQLCFVKIRAFVEKMCWEFKKNLMIFRLKFYLKQS